MISLGSAMWVSKQSEYLVVTSSAVEEEAFFILSSVPLSSIIKPETYVINGYLPLVRSKVIACETPGKHVHRLNWTPH